MTNKDHNSSGESSNEAKSLPNVYFEQGGDPNNIAETPDVKPSLIRNIIISLRPDYVLNHLDIVSLKVILRSWIQIWGTVFIVVIPASNAWMGSSSFLLPLFGFITPSGGTSIIINIFIAFVGSLAATIGWLFGVIAQLITNRIRGSPTTQDIAQQLIQDGSCTIDNIQACMSSEIYSGRYLQTDCSVIYAIALFMGIVFLGHLQQINPLFRIVYIISVIVLCISVCYNVFIPTFSPLLVSWQAVKTMYFAFAVKIVCSMFIFPETSSYEYFNGTVKILKQFKATAINNHRFFTSMKPSDNNFENYKNFKSEVINIRTSMIPLEIHASLSKFEVSYGRLGPGGMGEIRSHLKHLINIAASFEYLYQLIDTRQILSRGAAEVERHKSVVTESGDIIEGKGHHFKLFGSIHETYKPVGEFEHNQRLNLIKKRLQQKHSVLDLKSLDYICELLKPYFEPYLAVSHEAIDVLIEWIEAANQFRIYSIFNPQPHIDKQKELHEKLKTIKTKLQQSLTDIRDTRALEKYFEGKSSDEETMLSLISTASFTTFFIETRTKAELTLVDILLQIDEQVPTPKFFTYFTKSIFDSSKNIYHSIADEDPSEEVPSFDDTPKIEHRNPDASKASSIWHIIGGKLVKLYEAIYDELLWFWIRTASLTVATAIPFFCKTTAQWYFESRLVWVVVMCAISTSRYTGETIYTFIAKLVYTFFGCIVGMVAWYISAGRGNGNYYGFAAVTSVLFLYFCFYRHFSQHKTILPQILYPVTATLVLGTSWVDGNSQSSLVNVGYGFKPSYIRFASVVVGLSVGFIASIIPRPKSSKVAIRKILANIIDDIGDVHCTVSSFAIRRLENASFHITSRHDPVVEKLRMLLIKLASISALSNPVAYEFNLTGKWPVEKYKKLESNITDILQLYTMLLIIFDKIDNTKQWIKHIINRSGWYDVDINADLLSLVHMSSRSLRWKSPMPKITQATISLKHFDLLRQQWGIGKYSLNERFYNSIVGPTIDDMDTNAEQQNEKATEELYKSMVENLDYDKLFGVDGNLSIVALILCHMIYLKIDLVVAIVKSLVGEKYDLNEELFNLQIKDDKLKAGYKLD